MDGDFYTETYSYREGRIFLYKRPNSKYFQCRLNIENIKGYVIKSCKTSNIGKALKFAEDTYDNLRFKKLNNLPLKTKTFRQIFNEWFARANKSEYRQEFYNGRAKLYLFPYFGDYNVEDITENIIDDYWHWRRNYYKDNPDKLTGNNAEIPSAQSLKMEKTAIQEVLQYAHRRGYIRAVPAITFKPRAKTENRDTFNKDEYTTLLNGLSVWHTRARKRSDVYQRKMVYNLVLFLANTGIRPNEFYKIKWKNISVHTQGEIKILFVDVPCNTKTGQRTVVSLPEAYTCYNNIKSFSKYKKADDYFFTNYDGSSMKNVSKTYITLLKELNLYVSSEGKKRPVYSLRHYYATQRLLDGVNVYDLSRNMGTSVKQIENHYGHVLATQKSKELIQGTSKSDYQQNEEFRQEFGADLPQYNSFVLGEDDVVSNNKIEDLLKQTEKYANDIIKNEDDKKKMQEFLANKLKSI